ncbi:folate family ECF transporter S component [Pseudobutyrivibrio xylanivorans]|uniref:Folate family ECF transporter S component n=1 Tax=Pseudobutyrivibrio xylanivorans TaxID=185007 RepID=A0A5P6VTS0_PSEXY|nr:folate family ECF transporter S component [Pseudobutyrivibrio xylanivorans]QFJ55987.1 folate family ECF transporter S component [Pseudobutyrivibrio xylanivorans]
MKKLRDTKTLTVAAMLTAIGIVLGFFKIPVNQFIEIRFGSMPICLAGMLFGPGVGAVVGALVDIGGYLVKPTGPFFPGFTVSSAVSGIIYGLVLHGRRFTLPRIAVAQTIHMVVVGIILNSYWLNLLYFQNGYIATIVMRLPKELIMLPINIAITYVLIKAVEKVRNRGLIFG